MSGVMASTVFGAGNSPAAGVPISCRQPRTRSPMAQTTGTCGRPVKNPVASSATASLNCPTSPWSEPSTITPMARSPALPRAPPDGPPPASRSASPSPRPTLRE